MTAATAVRPPLDPAAQARAWAAAQAPALRGALAALAAELDGLVRWGPGDEDEGHLAIAWPDADALLRTACNQWPHPACGWLYDRGRATLERAPDVRDRDGAEFVLADDLEAVLDQLLQEIPA